MTQCTTSTTLPVAAAPDEAAPIIQEHPLPASAAPGGRVLQRPDPTQPQTEQDGIAPSSRFIGSPYDLEAHLAKKGTTSWVGYKEMDPLTADELHAFLAANADDPFYSVWLTLFTTCLRLGELTGLKHDDLDLGRAVITVKRSTSPLPGHGIVDGPTKTKKGRTVDLPATTVAVLRDHLTAQKVRKMAHRDVWQEQGYVFTTIYGTPLDPTPVGRAFAQALERAGLTARKLHNTRHTYATLLFAQGEHPKVVQEQLGHATIAITLDIYSAYIPTMGRSAAARMEAVLTTPCAADRAENS